MYSYSIHLQLDACIGVGIKTKDITYSYCNDTGVLYLYLNGLRLRSNMKDALPARKKSIVGKMYERFSFRGGKKTK